ncbi:hypothetical protein Rcae01_00603 [Novipirellula caenicola]|uniref:Uncharacterized protein n=1 Tax=Novipirellula caenicola TaxID=1536901 RepID=A0ABP9VN64_9BACT
MTGRPVAGWIEHVAATLTRTNVLRVAEVTNYASKKSAKFRFRPFDEAANRKQNGFTLYWTLRHRPRVVPGPRKTRVSLLRRQLPARGE